jgi:hypothetical protein
MYSMVELDGMEKLSPLVITTCEFKHWQLWKQQFQFGWGLLIPMTLPLSLKKHCWDSARLVDSLTMHQNKTKKN